MCGQKNLFVWTICDNRLPSRAMTSNLASAPYKTQFDREREAFLTIYARHLAKQIMWQNKVLIIWRSLGILGHILVAYFHFTHIFVVICHDFHCVRYFDRHKLMKISKSQNNFDILVQNTESAMKYQQLSGIFVQRTRDIPTNSALKAVIHGI